MVVALSPAESLVLLKPNRTPAREAMKVGLLGLLAQGAVRIEEEQKKGLLRTTKVVYLRPTGRRPASMPQYAAALLDCVQGAQAASGLMSDFVAQARQAFGANLEGFKSRFIMPVLVSHGLIEEGRTLLVFRTWRITPAGAAEHSRIQGDIERARRIPALLGTNPAEAAAIALAVGTTILLVSELRPYYGQISQAMRAHAAGFNEYDGIETHSGLEGGGSHHGHEHVQTVADTSSAGDAGPLDTGTHGLGNLNLGNPDLGHVDLGNIDFGSFNADAFSALDSGMASFDSGFDASSGGSSDSGSSGGDSGGGGGGDSN